MDTCRIFDAQQLMEQYGPEAKFIVLNFHSALQFLDRCIEDIDNQMMQYYTPMEETDESEVDSAEIDNILDEVEGLEKDGRLVSVRESESDCAFSEMEDVGCYFTEDDIPSDLEMGDDEVFYAGTGIQGDPVQID